MIFSKRKYLVSAPVLGHMYLLIKVHKKNFPGRAVVSQIDDPTYKICKILTDILNPIAYQRESYVDTNKETITYQDFINKELIHFSKYDCDRSIPNIMDGLKTSNRKILYVVIKQNITKEMKVAQLGALIAQISSYHHGEISLIKAIIGMA